MLQMEYLALVPANSSNLYDIVAYFNSQLPTLSDAGVSGLATVVGSMGNPLDGGATQVGGLLSQNSMHDTDNENDILGLFTPIVEHVNSQWPGELIFLPSIKKYGSFLEWFNANRDTNLVGNNAYFASWLLGKDALTLSPTNLKNAVKMSVERTGAFTSFFLSGKAVQNAQPRGGSNAVLPAWRKSYVHAVTQVVFPAHNSTANSAAINTLLTTWKAVRDLDPGSGSYINEVCPQPTLLNVQKKGR
jgi:hypothetical protein